MGNTKDKILVTALELFNTQGMAKVTLRTIASKMGISQGNLNYHFKKREDIVEALYFQIVESINQVIASSMQFENHLESVFSVSKAIMFTFYKYQFFLLDFVLIMREHKKIKTHYVKLIQQRELEFLNMIDVLIDKNLIRKPLFSNEYNNLFKRFQILSDFWMSSVVVEKGKITKASVHQYSEIIYQSIFPYLTLKGQKLYKSVSLA
ncbi:TetR/AcrR family transcriptional regulator [Hyunsoonleella pacifica]|uniref:TetR/AcrR family transcriptional regulator n=1 Tax=Hyunsoonleella pacifica TaxID=1080224 RepID=A0A4Q9FLH0_9FLAO|nr:TetR/AcrR family transcriptional regulator [Hyunsoonleella pacifica]TBN14631.1 TetR/AcrR family transcriptional regulator [Hyunsoonleella pacifica]GGD15404.1 TetR family transcriptional regulator [Hyunsoonleella pacifica]